MLLLLLLLLFGFIGKEQEIKFFDLKKICHYFGLVMLGPGNNLLTGADKQNKVSR